MAFLLIFSLLLSGVFVSSIPVDNSYTDIKFEEKSDIYPLRYELWLNFDRENINNYTGHVNIDFVSKIELHKFLINRGLDLKYDNINLLEGDVNDFQNLEHKYGGRYETDEIHKSGLIIKPFTKYTLSIDFHSKISNNEYTGIHVKEHHMNHNGEKQFYITTDFLPWSAHSVFPCFENIAFKSNFKLHITHDKKYTAISNTPGTRKETDDYVKTTFEETPMISVHTLKFILTEFKQKSLKSSGTINYNIYAEDSVLHETEYLLNKSEMIMTKVEEYFGMKYPLSKLDIFMERSLSSDHTEQMGLISARHSDYLANPDTFSFSDELYFNEQPVQIFVKQYLGNIITPKRWSDYWMFNGLTHYVEYDLLKEIMHNDQLVEWYYVDAPSVSFDDDLEGYLKKLGAETYILDLNRDEVYKNLKFYKGGAIFRMVSDIIGKDTFKKAIKYFIAENKFKSVNMEEFYTALNHAVQEDHTLPDGIDLKTFIESWSNEPGYPILTVTRDYAKGHIKLEQNRSLSHLTMDDDLEPATWWLPYNFVSKSNNDFTSTKPTGWMKNTNEKDFDSHVPNDEWIIFNKQQSYHYIVNYDIENWNMITKELNDGDFEKIHYLNRAKLLFDTHFLTQNGYLDYKILFDLLNYMRRETNYVVWKAADSILDDIYLKLHYTKYSEESLKYFKMLTSELYDKFSLDTNNFEEAALKNYIAHWACQGRNEKCLEETEAAADDVANALLHNTPSKFHPTIYEPILSFGFSDDKYTKLWNDLGDASYPARQWVISTLRNNLYKTVFEDILTKIFLSKSLQPEFDAREEVQILLEIESHHLLREVVYNVISKKPSLLFAKGNEKNLYKFLHSTFYGYTLDQDELEIAKKIISEAQKLQRDSTSTLPDSIEN